MKRLIYIMAAMLAAATFSCSSDSDELGTVTNEYDVIDPDSPMGLSYRESRVAELAAPFGWKLLSEMASDDNLVISPLSAEYALAMLANGATQEVRDEIISALFNGQITLDQANAYYYKLRKNLGEFDSQVTFMGANSIWYVPSISVKSDYRRNLALYYGARAFQYEKDKMAEAANSWISEQTNGLIPSAVGEGSDFMLVNVVYFSGSWMEKFLKNNTHTDIFHCLDGSDKETEFMIKDSYKTIKYGEGDGFCVASVPIGDGRSWRGYAIPGEGSFSMDFILPDPGTSLGQCLVSLCNSGYDVEEYPHIKLTVPKFSVNSRGSITDALKGAGISKALEFGTRYPGISDAVLSLEQILQSASLKIDEDGVVGAAASTTAFAGEGITSRPYEPLEITIDRPFLFCVRECSTGECLFIGQVTKM